MGASDFVLGFSRMVFRTARAPCRQALQVGASKVRKRACCLRALNALRTGSSELDRSTSPLEAASAEPSLALRFESQLAERAPRSSRVSAVAFTLGGYHWPSVVDMYGYVTMAVTAIKQQQRRIESLERELGELRRERAQSRAKAPKSAL